MCDVPYSTRKQKRKGKEQKDQKKPFKKKKKWGDTI